MNRHALLLAGAALLSGCAGTPARRAESSDASLYERVAALLKDRHDLDALGQPPPQLAEVAWMLGTWDIETTVFATKTTPEHTDQGTATITRALDGTWLQMADRYPKGTQDLGFLTYNLVTRRWVSLALDSNGNAVTSSAAAWEGNRLALIASEVEILGERVTLRQTITRVGENEFVLLNEEHLPSGAWVSLDRYRYTRSTR